MQVLLMPQTVRKKKKLKFVMVFATLNFLFNYFWLKNIVTSYKKYTFPIFGSRMHGIIIKKHNMAKLAH